MADVLGGGASGDVGAPYKLRAAAEKIDDGREKVEEKRFWKMPVPAPTPELIDWDSVRSEIVLKERRSRSKLRGSVVAVAYDPVPLLEVALTPELEYAEPQLSPPET